MSFDTARLAQVKYNNEKQPRDIDKADLIYTMQTADYND